MVTKEKRMDGVMERVLDIWRHQSWVKRSFTHARRGDSGHLIWSTNVFNWSESPQHLGHSMAPRTELAPILLTREDKVPAYVSYFISNYYAPCSPSSNHIGFHCIPQTHQPWYGFRAHGLLLSIPLLSYIHLDTPTSPSTNSSHVCLFLLTHISAQMLPLHQFLVDL